MDLDTKDLRYNSAAAAGKRTWIKKELEGSFRDGQRQDRYAGLRVILPWA
jgi:hypothetical protein